MTIQMNTAEKAKLKQTPQNVISGGKHGKVDMLAEMAKVKTAPVEFPADWSKSRGEIQMLGEHVRLSTTPHVPFSEQGIPVADMQQGVRKGRKK